MKYAIIIPDGAADVPLEELGGKTPLEAAHTPNMDWIAANGRWAPSATSPRACRAARTWPSCRCSATTRAKYYTGRAPLEAAAQGLKIAAGRVGLPLQPRHDHRRGHGGLLRRAHLHRGGRRPDRGTEPLAGRDERCSSIAGVSYRHLMTFRGDLRRQDHPAARHPRPGRRRPTCPPGRAARCFAR